MRLLKVVQVIIAGREHKNHQPWRSNVDSTIWVFLTPASPIGVWRQSPGQVLRNQPLTPGGISVTAVANHVRKSTARVPDQFRWAFRSAVPIR